MNIDKLVCPILFLYSTDDRAESAQLAARSDDASPCREGFLSRFAISASASFDALQATCISYGFT